MMRMLHVPMRSPLNTSKRLPGGRRKSSGAVELSSICSLRSAATRMVSNRFGQRPRKSASVSFERNDLIIARITTNVVFNVKHHHLALRHCSMVRMPWSRSRVREQVHGFSLGGVCGADTRGGVKFPRQSEGNKKPAHPFTDRRVCIERPDYACLRISLASARRSSMDLACDSLSSSFSCAATSEPAALTALRPVAFCMARLKVSVALSARFIT